MGVYRDDYRDPYSYFHSLLTMVESLKWPSQCCREHVVKALRFNRTPKWVMTRWVHPYKAHMRFVRGYGAT